MGFAGPHVMFAIANIPLIPSSSCVCSIVRVFDTGSSSNSSSHTVLLYPSTFWASSLLRIVMTDNMEFTLDWDLPDYPQLPKMFTNAKAAKKRKHKEFIMTEADLEQVVKIPKVAAGKPFLHAS